MQELICPFDDEKVQEPETANERSREASHSLANVEAKKVDANSASIAPAGVYKDIDYSFLKGYAFGSTNEVRAKVTFRSAGELKKSNDVRLRDDTIVKTEGYYNSGDGGNAVYMLLGEKKMKENKKIKVTVK